MYDPRTMSVNGNAAASGEQRWTAVILAVFGSIILAFAVHRAVVASFTHDESYSYVHYMKLSYWEVLTHVDAYTNNHLLNTLGMKAADQFLGNSELALRSPNLAALALFLFYAARLLLRLPRWFAICGFIVLGTNTYMLELFTLARGYGLSFGFMLMALFHLVRAIREARLRDIALFHVASVLATLSNFTLLNVHLAGLITLYTLLGVRISLGDVPRKRLVSVTLMNVVMVAFCTLLLWLPIQHTLERNVLDFGGKGGFFHSTVSTWFMSLLPAVRIPGPVMVAFYVVVVLIVGAGLVLTFQRLRKGDASFFTRWTALPTVLLVLVLTCLGGELQHALFGVDRMVNRFALFFVPLLVLLMIELLAVLHERGRTRVPMAVMSLAALWGVFSCARCFGPYHSVEWQYDVRTKDAITAIAHDMEVTGYQGPPVHVGINWLFEPALNFYRIRMKLDRVEELDRNGLTDHDAYRLVLQDQADTMSAQGYARMASYPQSNTVLFKKAK